MKVTVRDVAKRASVSPSTVSMVLNKKRGISEKTRLAVLEAVEDLGYKPPFPRGRESRGVIRFLKIIRHGHILNENHTPFIAGYIDGIEQEAREKGYTLEVQRVDAKEKGALQAILNQKRGQGVIVLSTELRGEDTPLFESYQDPLVFIDTVLPSPLFDYVGMDNEGVIFSLVESLKDLGHQRLGVVSSSLETPNFTVRKKAFQEALGYFGLEQNPRWNFVVSSTFDRAYEEMDGALQRRKDLPTVLFCVCDIIALGCMRALSKNGFSIPQDLSLIGFDDLPASGMTSPPLSSVGVPKNSMGRRAFQLLHRQMEAALPRERVYIGSELILRESVAAPREKIL